MCLGSDKSSGGAHGILCTEVDIVLLLPVDPVGPRALPEQRQEGKGGSRRYMAVVSYATVRIFSEAQRIFSHRCSLFES